MKKTPLSIDIRLINDSEDNLGKKILLKEEKTEKIAASMPTREDCLSYFKKKKYSLRLEKHKNHFISLLRFEGGPHEKNLCSLLLKELKGELACGGTVEENHLVLQSKDSDRIKITLERLFKKQ